MKLCPLFIFILLVAGCISNQPELDRISGNTGTFLKQLGTTTSFLPMGASVQNDQDSCTDMTVDKNGYIYCAGWTNTDLGESGGAGADPYIAKFKPDGRIVWITQLGTVTKDLNGAGAGDDGTNGSDDYCASVGVDDEGNVYCAGYTNGSSLDGPGSFQGGLRDAFVLKLNSSGELQWLQQIGTGVQEESSAMAVTSDGYVYVTGTIYGGEVVAGENPAAPGPVRGDQDVFIVKFDTDGTRIDEVQLGNITGGVLGLDVTGNDYARDINVDPNGNVFLVGSTLGNLKTTNPEVGISNDIFVWKLNSSLTTHWLTHHASPGSDTPTGITFSSDDKIFLTGRTLGSLGEANAGGSSDVFVMKLSSSGAVEKISQLGDVTRVPGGDTSRDEECYDIALDRHENVYCTGRTKGSIGEPNADPSNNTTDIFIARWDRDLEFQSAVQFGRETSVPGGSAALNDNAWAIYIDYFGHLYLGGDTNSNLGETNKGMLDIYIMKQDMSTLDFKAPRF